MSTFFPCYTSQKLFFWHVVYKLTYFFMSHATHFVYLEIWQFQVFDPFATSVNSINLTFIDSEPPKPACSYHNSWKCFYPQITGTLHFGGNTPRAAHGSALPSSLPQTPWKRTVLEDEWHGYFSPEKRHKVKKCNCLRIAMLCDTSHDREKMYSQGVKTGKGLWFVGSPWALNCTLIASGSLWSHVWACMTFVFSSVACSYDWY